MEYIIESSKSNVFIYDFRMEDGSWKTSPVGVGYLPQESKVFFYPADADLMIKHGIKGLPYFLQDWVVYTKIINKEQVSPIELEACNRVNAYYLDYLEHYFDNKKFDLPSGEPFTRKWNALAWKEMKQHTDCYNLLKDLFKLNSDNVSAL